MPHIRAVAMAARSGRLAPGQAAWSLGMPEAISAELR